MLAIHKDVAQAELEAIILTEKEILNYLHKVLKMNHITEDIISIQHNHIKILTKMKKQLNYIKKELRLMDGMKKYGIVIIRLQSVIKDLIILMKWKTG